MEECLEAEALVEVFQVEVFQGEVFQGAEVRLEVEQLQEVPLVGVVQEEVEQ